MIWSLLLGIGLTSPQCQPFQDSDDGEHKIRNADDGLTKGHGLAGAATNMRLEQTAKEFFNL